MTSAVSSRTSGEAAPIRDLLLRRRWKSIPDESATRLSGMTLYRFVFFVFFVALRRECECHRSQA
jgi:hypothetical protein